MVGGTGGAGRGVKRLAPVEQGGKMKITKELFDRMVDEFMAIESADDRAKRRALGLETASLAVDVLCKMASESPCSDDAVRTEMEKVGLGMFMATCDNRDVLTRLGIEIDDEAAHAAWRRVVERDRAEMEKSP